VQPSVRGQHSATLRGMYGYGARHALRMTFLFINCACLLCFGPWCVFISRTRLRYCVRRPARVAYACAMLLSHVLTSPPTITCAGIELWGCRCAFAFVCGHLRSCNTSPPWLVVIFEVRIAALKTLPGLQRAGGAPPQECILVWPFPICWLTYNC
jgi:hypothetical protein